MGTFLFFIVIILVFVTPGRFVTPLHAVRHYPELVCLFVPETSFVWYPWSTRYTTDHACYLLASSKNKGTYYVHTSRLWWI